MGRRVQWIGGLLLVLCITAVVADNRQLPATERLVYQASYHGPLSGNQKIPIARVILQTLPLRLPLSAGPLFETGMWVSSEISPLLEETYPFRVHFRSLYQATPFSLLALEKYKRSDEVKHEVTWVDDRHNRVGRYRPHVSGTALPPTLVDWLNSTEPFGFYKPARHKASEGLVDRLAMIQSVRQQPMRVGAEYRYPVTDGKRLLDYRIKVLGLEQIHMDGIKKPAWKLVFRAWYSKKGATKLRHRPIYLWLSSEHPALPLRFSHDHPLGLFTVDLQDSGG